MKLNSRPSVQMFIFLLFFAFVFTLLRIHASDLILLQAYMCLCARVCFMCNSKLAGSCRFGGEANYGRRGLCLVRFMLNSVSISSLLPSLQQKAQGETQAHRNPLALTGAVFNHLSQGPGPRSTVNKHSIEIISSLFCSSFLCSHSFHLPLPLYVSLVLNPLHPLSVCFFSSLPPHPSPSGTSRCLSHVVLVQSLSHCAFPSLGSTEVLIC